MRIAVLILVVVTLLVLGVCWFETSAPTPRTQGEDRSPPPADGPRLGEGREPAEPAPSSPSSDPTTESSSPWTVQGRVYTAERRPVPQATVDAWWRLGAVIQHLGTSTVDEAGAYAIDASALQELSGLQHRQGRLLVRARARRHAPGYQRLWPGMESTSYGVAVDVREPGALGDVDLVLDSGVTLTGRVLDEAGNPVPGAVIEADSVRRLTAPDGRFALRVSGDTPVQLSAHRLDRGSEVLGPLQISKDSETDVGDVRLRRDRGIAGVVLLSDGTPAPGAALVWCPEWWSCPESPEVGGLGLGTHGVYSDVGGNFWFDTRGERPKGRVVAAEVMVGPSVLGEPASADVEPDEELRLVLRGHRLAIQVTDVTGVAIPQARVFVGWEGSGSTGAAEGVEVHTTDEGWAYVLAPPETRVRLTALVARAISTTREVVVPLRPSTSEVRLRIEEPVVTGTLRLEPAGEAPGGKGVRILHPSGILLEEVRLDRDQVNVRVAPGEYDVSFPVAYVDPLDSPALDRVKSDPEALADFRRATSSDEIMQFLDEHGHLLPGPAPMWWLLGVVEHRRHVRIQPDRVTILRLVRNR